MLWAGLGFMFLSMRKVDLFGGKFSSDWRSVSASCVCTAVSLISRHCTTNLKPVPGILVHSYTVKMMVGDEQAAQLPRKSLLTLDQQNSCSDIFVSISGLIGAGKTTLATKLAEKMNLPVFYEPVIDNVYLDDFYKDPARYGFPLQVFLLNRRFQQHQQIIWQGKGGVQDRTIYEDSVFAKVLRDSGMMEEREYQTYLSLFSNMSNFMKKPNLIVHLDVSPEESKRRIDMRQRECESTISVEYLKNLHSAYEEFIKDIARIIPVIRVNYERFRSADEMADIIVREYSEMTTVRHVDFSDSDQPKNLKMSKQQQQQDPVRASPQLMTEVAH